MADAPTLITPRLILKAFSDDLLSERYVGWLNDADVVRYSEQRHQEHSVGTCRHFIQSFKSGPNHLWAIIEMVKGLGHIGNINTAVDAANKVADIAILIGEKQAWSTGLGFEAWTAVVDHLLGAGGMRKVTAGCMADNKGMLAVMEKSGMTEEGRRVGNFLLDGKPVDLVMVAKSGVPVI